MLHGQFLRLEKNVRLTYVDSHQSRVNPDRTRSAGESIIMNQQALFVPTNMTVCMLTTVLNLTFSMNYIVTFQFLHSIEVNSDNHMVV